MLLIILSLISSVFAYGIPTNCLICQNVNCTHNTNVSSCVSSCCCIWCNSTMLSGPCILTSSVCPADTVGVECIQDAQTPTYVVVFICVAAITFLVWLIWLTIKITSNDNLCCLEEYSSIPHL